MITSNSSEPPERFVVCFLSNVQERRLGEFLESLRKESWSGIEVDRIEHRVRELLGAEFAVRETTAVGTATHTH